MSKVEKLTDEQWAVLEPLFQEERTGAGRPQVHSNRAVLAFFGSCAQVLPGVIYRKDFLHHPLVTADSANG